MSRDSRVTPPADAPDHYSYQHYRSRDVAEGFDALRFGGPIGQLLLETQEALLAEALAPAAGRRVLDVGTGTGRAALALAGAGASVVGVDASEEMLAVARRQAAERAVDAEFEQGDAHHLRFPDRSFDAAVSLRVLMHTPGWTECLAELCRVSRWRVVIDFPSSQSLAAIESLARRARLRLGGTTEAYRVMSVGQVTRAFATHGFHVVDVRRQFVLPIALHKRLGSRRFTEAVEHGMAAIGLLRLFGSPITLVAQRTEASRHLLRRES